MINPDYLRTLIVLAETHNFTRTAIKLNMTQPGVTQHIQKLEDYFQTALIHRTGKRFTLTEAGHRLISYSQQIFLDHERLRVEIGKDDPKVGLCKYASPGSFGLKLFDSLLMNARNHPQLQVSLSVAPNASIPGLLISRQIDVGFMTQEPTLVGIEFAHFSDEKLLVAAPKKLALRKFSEVLDIDFINHPDGIGFLDRILKVNRTGSKFSTDQVKSRVFINQVNRILDPVAEGLGFTVIPEGVFEKFGDSKRISTVNTPHPVVDKIYRVVRAGELIPSRYGAIEKELQK